MLFCPAQHGRVLATSVSGSASLARLISLHFRPLFEVASSCRVGTVFLYAHFWHFVLDSLLYGICRKEICDERNNNGENTHSGRFWEWEDDPGREFILQV